MLLLRVKLNRLIIQLKRPFTCQAGGVRHDPQRVLGKNMEMALEIASGHDRVNISPNVGLRSTYSRTETGHSNFASFSKNYH